MEDFHNLFGDISSIKKVVSELEETINEDKEDVMSQRKKINELVQRVNKLLEQFGQSPIDEIIPLINEINHSLSEAVNMTTVKTDADKDFDLNKSDVLVAIVAGGLAVLVDFLIVKVPKDMNITLNGETQTYEGSSLTALLRKFGETENGNKSQWVETLEKWFHVDYDPSIKEGVLGMYPKNHRVFGLAHDPGIMGLIWGIKDIVCGTFSYIGKDGLLHIEKVADADFKKLLYAPFLWLGHILSDVFTKQGIPIPGNCFLRMFHIGSFGDKQRTVAEMAEYMYVQGYDLRHLATMSTCSAVIELLINTYCFFISNKKEDESQPLFEREYIEVKNEEKKRKLMFTSYSVAVAGNIGKVAVYGGNPFAINAAIWYGFVKEAISQVIIKTSDTQNYIEVIENRHLIDQQWEKLLKETQN